MVRIQRFFIDASFFVWILVFQVWCSTTGNHKILFGFRFKYHRKIKPNFWSISIGSNLNWSHSSELDWFEMKSTLVSIWIWLLGIFIIKVWFTTRTTSVQNIYNILRKNISIIYLQKNLWLVMSHKKGNYTSKLKGVRHFGTNTDYKPTNIIQLSLRMGS